MLEQHSPPSPAMVLELATVYQTSQALIAAVKLGIPDLLAGRSIRSANLAQETGCGSRIISMSTPDSLFELTTA
jgi:hypothetical protein